MESIKRIDSADDSMKIDWTISDVCNYKCNYCHEENYGGKSGWPDYNSSVKFFEYIHKEVNNKRKDLLITGGEPTMWPKLFDFVKQLDNSYRITLNTNGSRTLRWWEKFKTQIMHKFHDIVISCHLEYADVDHLINVCKILQDVEDRKTFITVFLLADIEKNKFEKLKQTYQQLVNANLRISITVKPIKVYSKKGMTQDYTKEQMEFINTSYRNNGLLPPEGYPPQLIVDGKIRRYNFLRKIVTHQKNNFKGWKCAMGSHRLVIWHSGEIYGALCGTAKKTAHYGNINDFKSIKINSEPVVCQTEWCSCLLDIFVPKWKEDV